MFKNDLDNINKLTKQLDSLENELIQKVDDIIFTVNSKYNGVLNNYDIKLYPPDSAVAIELILTNRNIPDEPLNELQKQLGASKKTQQILDDMKLRVAYFF